MTTCGIRRRSFIAALFSLPAIAAAGIIGVAGCGTASSTYSPVVKSSNVQPAFTIAVGPPSVSVIPGGTANYTVTITETGGFNSPISLSASGLPSGASAAFGEQTPTAGGATVSLAISTSNQAEEAAVIASQSKLAKPAASVTRQVTPLGSSTITVTATGGGITQTATTTLVVTTAPDFSITLTPTTVGSNIVSPGGTATYIARVTSIAGFSTPVTLSLSGQPANTTTVFGSTTVTPTAAGATTTVNIVTSQNEGAETSMGTYPITLVGTGGSTSHTYTASLGVGSFTVTVAEATPGSGMVAQGQTAHYIVKVTSVNGFAPSITLTGPALPVGCAFTFGVGTLTPTAAGATTTLTITTSETATPSGNVDFSVGGQGGGWFTVGSGDLDVTES